MLKKTLVFLLMLSVLGCVPSSSKKKRGTPTRVEGQSGLMIPQYGLTIGAKYEPELDQLVKGYRIVTVALTNNAIEPIQMDPNKDKWVIETATGKKIKAINSLRIKDYKKWLSLSPKMRALIDYPSNVPIGFTQTFDLFIKGKLDLKGFRLISYFNSHRALTFDIRSDE